MAAITIGATSSTLANATFHLPRLPFLSAHRICLRILSPPLRVSLNHLTLSSPKLLLPRTARGLPPTRGIQSSADSSTAKKSTKKVVTLKKKRKPGEEPRYSKAARRFYNEKFGEQPQRLAKVLAAAGVASRRSSEELIFQGKVTVNGSVCDTPQTRVNPARDIIYVNGNRLPKRLPPKVYLALNKPKGYIAAVNGEVHKRHVMAINQGTTIDGVHCTPEFVELLPRQPDIPRARFRIVVNEGRNHEVRELVKNAGLEIYSLKRIRIGGFRLSTDLGLGKYIELKENDLKSLGMET
ncbi:putative ribosomal large subunit pseudouridine synthase SVR1, chloroplastic isoform X3 [Beta vulgaris subsp. vulgaris]|uniref:putative ribosomal large subunit pseudouridine synthase SVR1, chloroplastic isoform X3 n=1 Tax=Beta vulgaris subsp. vulgaris TaxID=3555 RepID=UPI002037129C|nr:putative ribosomal large subunit pseudouridine synthase SVR1, chloroplastic isoform X3 [Beta vulgaris subsp. vulgaris]